MDRAGCLPFKELQVEGVAEQSGDIGGAAPVQCRSGTGPWGYSNRASNWSCSAMEPPGRQVVIPMRPPGRQTRVSCRATARWSGAKTTPCAEDTTSNEASG